MKITGQTTFAELATERARLGIEWISLIHNDADPQHRVRLSGVLTIGGVVMGYGDDFASAFAELFGAADRAVTSYMAAIPDRRSMWTFQGLTHEIIDEEDDHRVLLSRCRQRFNFISAAHREQQLGRIDCAKCEALYAEVQRG